MKNSVCTLLFLFVSSSGFAETLTWTQCVERAKKNNEGLRAAISSFESSEEEIKKAQSSFYPAVNGNLEFNKTGSSSDAGSSTSKKYGGSLSLNQNLFSGFKDIRRIRQLEARQDASQARLKGVRAKLSFDLKSAFENLNYAKDFKELTKQILNRRNENLRTVELSFDGGRENKGSVLLSRAYFNQAKLDELQSSHEIIRAKALLAQAIGEEESDDLDISGEVPFESPDLSRPNMKLLALKTPEYLEAQANEEASHQEVKIARGGFSPSLDLRGSVGKEGPDFFPNESNQWSLGVALSFPLFSGGKDYYSVRSASFLREEASHRLVETSRDRLSELQKAYSDYVEGVQKLKVDESFKEAAQIRAEISRKRYNNGLITFDDWDIIENDLISRQKAFLQSKRARVLVEATWEMTQGIGVIK